MFLRLSFLLFVLVITGSMLGRFILPGAFSKSPPKSLLFLLSALALGTFAFIRAWELSIPVFVVAALIFLASFVTGIFKINQSRN